MKRVHHKIGIKCLQCSKTPFLTIIPRYPIQIKQQCKCSTKIYLLSEYLEYLPKLNQVTSTITTYCQSILSHSNNPVKGFCIKCKEYYCEKCFSMHWQHSYLKKHVVFFKENFRDHTCYDKKHHNSYFCVTCHCLYCPRCEKEHYSHSIFFLLDILYIKINDIKKTVKHVNKLFRVLLHQTFKKANSKDKELVKSYTKCLKTNSQIIDFIKILLSNYDCRIDNFLYAVKLNIFRHRNFNLNPSSFKTVLKLKSLNDYISFFNNFLIINKIDSYNEIDSKALTKKEVRKLPIKINNYHYTITCILPIKETLLLYGDNKGNILLNNLNDNEIEFVYYCAHSGGINYLHQSPFSNHFLSCSFDNSVIIWQFCFEFNKYWFTFYGKYTRHNSLVLEALFIQRDIVASISSDSYKVWNINSLELQDGFSTSEISPKKLYFHLLCDYNSNSLFTFSQYEMMKTEISSLKMCVLMKRLMFISNSAIFLTKDSKIFMFAYINRAPILLLYNIITQMIETFIKADNLFISRIMPNNYINFVFLEEKDGVLVIWTKSEELLYLDRKTMTFTKTIFFHEKDDTMITTKKLDDNSFISVDKNNDISIWTL